VYCVWQVVKTVTIIFNSPVLRTGLLGLCTSLLQPVSQRTQRTELQSLSIIRWRKLTTTQSIMQFTPSAGCSQLSTYFTASRYARKRIFLHAHKAITDFPTSVFTKFPHLHICYRKFTKITLTGVQNTNGICGIVLFSLHQFSRKSPRLNGVMSKYFHPNFTQTHQ
jgi:hypothetical protein